MLSYNKGSLEDAKKKRKERQWEKESLPAALYQQEMWSGRVKREERKEGSRREERKVWGILDEGGEKEEREGMRESQGF